MKISRFLALAYLVSLDSTGALGAQEALSPFDAVTVELNASGPPFRRLADLDGDGDVDAVGWHVSEQGDVFRLRSYINRGAGTFMGTPLMELGDSSRALTALGEIGFLDAGNVPDLCIVHGNQRHLFIGKGDGTFAPGPVDAIPTPPSFGPTQRPKDVLAITLSDLDGDGRDDFVWVDAKALGLKTASGLQASILHGVAGPLTVRVLRRDGPARPRFRSAHHQDGGASDVFLVHGDASVALFYGSLTTGIEPAKSFVHGMTMTMFDTGDVDGDGDVDGVVFGTHDYRVLRRASPGAWDLEPAVAGGPAKFLRDVDGDGDLDGACCGGGSGPTFEPHNKPSSFQIAMNDGSGAFAAAFLIPNVGSPELAGVADMDSDGDLDLVAGLGVYFASGALQPPVAAPPGSVIPSVRDAREIADCNGDGSPDVCFALDSAYLNDGSGHFLATTHGVSGAPGGASLRGPGFPGDFDGDGDLDLLVELHSGRPRVLAGSAPGQGRSLLGMALLRNGGQGALSYGGLASAPGVSFALDSLDAGASLTADLDGDGDLDLITRAMAPAMSGLAVSRAWLNDGAGSFTRTPFPDRRRVEVTGDLDLDGRTDLVVTEYPPYFGYPNLRSFHAVGPVSPPSYVDDVGRPLGRLMAGPVSLGNLYSRNFPDPGYPDLFFMGGSTSWLGLNGYDPGVGSWGAAILGADLPNDALCLVGDLNLDGLDDQLVGAFGTYVKRSAIRTKIGPDWSQGGLVSTTQILPTGQLVDLDQDGDLDLLGERVVLNRTVAPKSLGSGGASERRR